MNSYLAASRDWAKARGRTKCAMVAPSARKRMRFRGVTGFDQGQIKRGPGGPLRSDCETATRL